MNWQKIGTAPRDGTEVWLCWMYEGSTHANDVVRMQWGHIQRNGMIPGKVGMWVCPGGNFTWHDDPDGGPTHWASTCGET